MGESESDACVGRWTPPSLTVVTTGGALASNETHPLDAPLFTGMRRRIVGPSEPLRRPLGVLGSKETLHVEEKGDPGGVSQRFPI